MAVLAVAAVGSMVGNAVLAAGVMGISGAAIGWTVGSLVGSQLLGPGDSTTTGPRLSDLKVGDSAYGGGVPRIYGSARVAGNVIWMTPLRETKHTSRQGGKGGPKQTVEEFTYDVGMAVAFAVGPGSIRRVWINRELAFDASATSIEGVAASNQGLDGWRFYRGDELQEPDPDIVAYETANPDDGQPVRPVPAFRGLVYMVNGRLQLADYGNRPPSIEAEIVADFEAPENSPRIMKTAALNFDSIGGLAAQPWNEFLVQPYSGGYHSGYREMGGITYFLASGNNDGGGWANITDVDSHGFTIQSNDTDTAAALGYVSNTREYSFDFDGNLVNTAPKSDNLFAESVAVVISSAPQYNIGGIPAPWVGTIYNGLGSVSGSRVWFTPDAPDIIGVSGLPMKADYSGGQGKLSYTQASCVIVGEIGVNAIDQGGFAQALIGAGQQGRRLVGLVLSSDSSCMIAFTCAMGDLYANQWVKLNVAAGLCYAVDQGVCDPAERLAGFFGIGLTITTTASLEEDGRTMWSAQYDASRGNIRVRAFQIDENSKEMRQFFSQETTVRYDVGLFKPGILAKNGLCVVFSGRSGFVVCARTPQIDRKSTPLAYVVKDLCLRSKLREDQIDVSQLEGDDVDGFVIASAMTSRAAIEPLRAAYFFDAVESDAKLKFVKRGQPVIADIPEADMAAHDGAPNELPDTVVRTRAQSQEIPHEVAVTYPSTGGEYQIGSQYARRTTVRSSVVNKMDLPICMSDDKAAQIAAVNLYTAWQQVESFAWSTTRKYDYLDPTDVVRIHKGDSEWVVRITKRSEGANGIINWEGVEEDAAVYSQEVKGGRAPTGQQEIVVAPPTDMRALNVPTLRDSDGAAPMALFAAAPQGSAAGWKGSSLFQSRDGGQMFFDTGISFNSASAIGVARSLLAAPPNFGTIDILNYVDVTSTAELSSIPVESLLRYENVCMIGGELLAFGRAELIGPGAYRLSNLLRGLKGTEDAAGSHAAGDQFVLIDIQRNRLQTLPASDIGQTLKYKAPSFGQSLDQGRNKSLLFTGRNMLPLSPVFPNATKNTAAGDWTLTWRRRTRIGGDWRGGVDVELGETSELYDVEIYTLGSINSFNGATLKRTLSNVTQSQAVYTAAMQIADFGGPQDLIGFKVYQRSSVVGRGVPAECIRRWFAPSYNGGFLAPFTGNLEMRIGSLLGSIGPITEELPDLWLKFSGPNASTTFIDSSPAALPFTASGSAALSTVRFKRRWSSGLFNGSGYIDTPAAASFDITGRNFNIVFPILRTNSTGTQTVAGQWGGNGSYGWLVQMTASTMFFHYSPNGSLSSIQSLSFPLAYNDTRFQWIEFDCKDGSLICFVNGAQVGSTQNVSALFNSAAPLNIGRNQDGNQQYLQGYLGDFQIWKESRHRALHSIPPDVLITGNGTNGSKDIVDDSGNDLTCTVNGAVEIDTSKFPAGVTEASIKFPGGGNDVVFVQDHPGQDLGSTKLWTVRAWVNPSSLPNQQNYFLGKVASGNRGYGFGIVTSPPCLQMYYTQNGNTDQFLSAPMTMWTNEWKEVQIAFDGSTVFFSLNGALLGSTPFSGNIFNSTADLALGTFGNFNIPSLSFTGNVAQVRVLNGQCMPATYTPGSGPNVQLKFDGPNDSTIAKDTGYRALPFTANGGVKISTAESVSGGSSSEFNGSNAYWSTPSSDAMKFTGDFTVKFDLFVRALTRTFGTVLGSNSTTFTSGRSFAIMAFGPGDSNAGRVGLTRAGGGPLLVTSAPPSTGAFHRYEFSRVAGVLSLFVDGVLSGSVSNSETLDFGYNGSRIGSNGWDGAQSFLDGFIDNFEVYTDRGLNNQPA